MKSEIANLSEKLDTLMTQRETKGILCAIQTKHTLTKVKKK